MNAYLITPEKYPREGTQFIIFGGDLTLDAAIERLCNEDPFLITKDTFTTRRAYHIIGDWIVHFSGHGTAGRRILSFDGEKIETAIRQAEAHPFIKGNTVNYFQLKTTNQ